MDKVIAMAGLSVPRAVGGAQCHSQMCTCETCKGAEPPRV